MTPLASMCLLVGLIIGCVVLAKLLSVGAFTITKKQTPAVRVSPELLQRQREEVIFTAIKVGHQKRAGQQKANWK